VSLPSAKDEEERDFEHYNRFIVKLELISLKQGHICRYGQQFLPFILFLFFNICYVSFILVVRDCCF
jgi:hypothetical protein